MNSEKVILWGGTGQSKVMRPIIEGHPNHEVIAVFDDTEALAPPFKDIPLYQGWGELNKIVSQNYGLKFLVTIGNPHAKPRREISQKLISYGLTPFSAIDSSSLIQPKVKLGLGAQVHPGSIINSFTTVGDYCIINTGSIVEHDAKLEDGVEIGPGATVCGCVRVGLDTWIGAGAMVRDHIRIGENCIIGAGSVVVKDIPDNTVVVGNPARFLKNNISNYHEPK